MSAHNSHTQEEHNLYQKEVSQTQETTLEPPLPPPTHNLPPPPPTQNLRNSRIPYSPAELVCLLNAVDDILPSGLE